ncbi:roadblock/LC7 domain-containing protein [Streptomyces sp. NPDC005423]|uniref:roadblock/LC7 domain-containing protein n=1 Tax=Streptomyces sp. NPDC005423 TaxID=3155343 RepID=UPI0033A156A1
MMMSTDRPTGTASIPDPESPLSAMDWLIARFTDDVPGVTHAILVSKDGMALLFGNTEKDWADGLAAAVSGLASLGAGISGPTCQLVVPQQIIIERGDCFIFVQNAGSSTHFKNHNGLGKPNRVDTLLCVIADPNAHLSNVGFEMSRLINQFAPYMQIPVRVVPGAEA